MTHSVQLGSTIPPDKTAFVTTLCKGDGYAPGVEALGHSLRRHGSTRARVLMVTPDVSSGVCFRLARQGWDVRAVPWLSSHSQRAPMFARFGNTFNKLHAWSLTDFTRVVLMDADTIAVQNIDDLFARPNISAAPDFLLPDRFNSGVLVLEPSHVVYEAMLAALDERDSYDGGDQGFLNSYFRDWYGAPLAHRLPAGDNMPQFIYQFMRAQPCFSGYLEREVRVIHYSVQKPWMNKATLVGGSAVWWSMYNAAQGGGAAESWMQRVHEAEDWSFGQALRSVLG